MKRNLIFGVIYFVFMACLSCGSGMMNVRNPNLQAKSSNSEQKPKVDKELELEKTIQLTQDLDLSTLAFDSAGETSAASVADYMSAKKLKTVLLIFCQEDTAVCRMINRDLKALPIGEGSSQFEVIGVLVDEAKNPEELAEHVKFDDHLTHFLDQNVMEKPESDIVPYFALMFLGKSKQGIVERWALDNINHEDLKKNIEKFLQDIGSAP